MDFGLPSSMDRDLFVRMVQTVKRDLEQFKSAGSNLLVAAGIRARADAVTFEKPVIVDGSLTANGALTINGPATITGTLSLPAGIIDNAALASPVEPGSAGLTQSNYATTTAGALYAQASIPVPAGYTRAIVQNGVSAGASNNTAATDFLYVAASINGVEGGEQASQAAAGAYASGSAFAIRTLTGLTGGSITVECRIRTGTAGWAAATGNTANVNALVLFLK